MAAVRRPAVAATRLWRCAAASARRDVESGESFISDKNTPPQYNSSRPELQRRFAAPPGGSVLLTHHLAPSVSPSALRPSRLFPPTHTNHLARMPRGALLGAPAEARAFNRVISRGIAGSTARGRTSGAEGGGGDGAGHAMLELKLAQTGEGIAECELLQWFVGEGEEVRAFQRVCQVQSDKATVDITSRFDGRVLRAHFTPGDIVKVGETLLDILPPGAGKPATSAPPPHDTSSSQSQLSPSPSSSSSAATSASSPDDQHAILAVPAVRHLAKTHGINLADVEGTGRDGRVTKEDVLAYVQTRQGVEEEMRMEEHVLEGPEPTALDISTAAAGGVGAAGRVASPAAAAAVAAVPAQHQQQQQPQWESVEASSSSTGRAHLDEANDVLLPMRGYRRAMARAMAAAASVPHFTFMDEVSMDAALALRSQLNATHSKPVSSSPASSPSGSSASAAASGAAAGKGAAGGAAGGGEAGGVARLSHLPILVKALSVALQAFPTLNSTLDDDSYNHLRCKGAHNIGIAMATPSGLVVPNVKNCQSKSIPQIAAEIERLRRLALQNQLPNEDVTGGTISVSNIGSIGGTYATPLVNAPEVAIVALGRIHTVPRFGPDGRTVIPAAVMNVSWSADHRVIDGATLAAFSAHWKSFIQCPATLLLHLM